MGQQSTAILMTAGLAVATLLAATGSQIGSHRSELAAGGGTLQFDRGSNAELGQNIHYPPDKDWLDELARLGLMSTTSEIAATSSDPLAIFGETIAQNFLNNYLSLKQSGEYTPEKAEEVGRAIGSNIRLPTGFSLHGEHELTLSADTSREGVLKYRADMREALVELVNGSPPEFEVFALYIETRNPERLHELKSAATRYKNSAEKSLAVIVPDDATKLHIRVVNALGSFGNSIDQLVRSVSSPIATLGVLRTYNEAEREMLYAFDALASYYVRKSSE